MDLHQLLFQTLQTLIEVGIATLEPVIIKFVFTKISLDNLLKYKALAQIAVAAVEQTMADAHVDEKKAAAEQKLSQLTKGALSPEEVDHLIENAVFALKQQIVNSIPVAQPVPAKEPIGFAPNTKTEESAAVALL